MIASAWYPLLQYHLNFGYSDKLSFIVNLIYTKYKFDPEIKEEVLLNKLENIKDSEIEKSIRDFYRYVPYRLLSPFYSDKLTRAADNKKNRLILDISQKTDIALYKILLPKEAISINNNWYWYIYKNQNIVSGWMNYKLIYFLQKKNPNVPALPFKLSAPYQRDLNIAKKFWKLILEQQNINDIYTNKPLKEDYFLIYGERSIDHFIPWSFVLHDELWNLVPTFKSVNSSKSNKLPKLDLYFDKFSDMQYSAFSLLINSTNRKESNKLLEDYLNINRSFDLNSLIHTRNQTTKNVFNKSLKDTILPLFQIAYNQGYELWHWQNNII
jgi:hypothetical protein